jgi:RNA polymerase sigma-70 factor (ECF subfamily)
VSDGRLSIDAGTDEDLALRARAGSHRAFEALVARYDSRLFNFVLRRLGNSTVGRHDEALDMTQESLLRAWRAIDRYDPSWRFSTWLFTIAHRLVIEHHRAAARRRTPHMAGGAAGHAHSESREPDPADAALVREARENLWSVAERVLSERPLSALWLRYAEALPLADVARVIGRSPVAVRVMLLRARGALAAALEPAGVESRPPPSKLSDDPRPLIDEDSPVARARAVALAGGT